MRKSHLKFALLNAKRVEVPSSFFSMILGLVGLGNCWRIAVELWHLPIWIGESIMLLAVAVWLMLLLLYISKWLWARKAAPAEFKHPVLCCFIALVPLSTVMIAVAIAPYTHALAVALFIVGAIGSIALGTLQLLLQGKLFPPLTPAKVA